MSLWADYVTELRGGSVQFIEHPDCFISYSFPPWADNCIMVNDIYVVPALRKSGRGKALFEDVCAIGRKSGKKFVAAELHLDTHIYAESMRAQLAVGLVPVAAENGKIFMRGEL